MRQSILGITAALEPNETKTFEISAIDGRMFVAQRLILADTKRQYEMVRSWRRKGWTNRLVIHAPPVEILGLRTEKFDILAPVAIPSVLFAADTSPDFSMQPALRFFLTVHNMLADKPYVLRGGIVGYC
jgi:hypothetical protein